MFFRNWRWSQVAAYTAAAPTAAPMAAVAIETILFMQVLSFPCVVGLVCPQRAQYTALAHYRRLGVRFDCIYSGYLSEPGQALLVEQAMEYWPGALKVVDPVMGDHGRLYSGLPGEMVPAMYALCSRADLILPNATEAALLLGDPLPGSAAPEYAAGAAERLTRLCPQVLLTGVTAGRSVLCVGAQRGQDGYTVRTPLLRPFHGTGDIFGAAMVGRLLQGNAPQAAAQAAAVFVGDCLRATPEGADERLGVWLESVLPRLLPAGES